MKVININAKLHYIEFQTESYIVGLKNSEIENMVAINKADSTEYVIESYDENCTFCYGSIRNCIFFSKLNKSSMEVVLYETDLLNKTEKVITTIPFVDQGELLAGEYPVEMVDIHSWVMDNKHILVSFSETNGHQTERLFLVEIESNHTFDLKNTITDEIDLSDIEWSCLKGQQKDDEWIVLKTGCIQPEEKTLLVENQNFKYACKEQIILINKFELIEAVLLDEKVESYVLVNADLLSSINYIGMRDNEILFEYIELKTMDKAVYAVRLNENRNKSFIGAESELYLLFEDQLFGVDNSHTNENVQIFHYENGKKVNHSTIDSEGRYLQLLYCSSDNIIYSSSDYGEGDCVVKEKVIHHNKNMMNFDNRHGSYDNEYQTLILYY